MTPCDRCGSIFTDGPYSVRMGKSIRHRICRDCYTALQRWLASDKETEAIIPKCDCCGKTVSVGTVLTHKDGSVEGPYIMCRKCYSETGCNAQGIKEDGKQ